MTSLCLAHLSDIHFGIPSYSLAQFFSKRWIGNLNYLCFRRRSFQSNHLFLLPDFFSDLGVEAVCFTGDFTTTAQEKEFLLAKKFSQLFSHPFFVLPGNHDVYTKEAERAQIFYKHFPSSQGEWGFSLKEDRIFCKEIKKDWYWIALDCAVATAPFQSYGIFTELMGDKLIQILSSLPKNAHVIMGNHFPLFTSKNPQHDLKNSFLLRKILKNFYPKIRLYLHGHIHKAYIINKMKDGYPLVLNCGSSAYVENGDFYLIKLDKYCTIDHFFYKDNKGWISENNYQY